MGERQYGPGSLTAHRYPHATISVVVDPGPPPHATPWDLELHGPLDAEALEDVLGEFAADDPDRSDWRHLLLRHGPDHHTLRFSAKRKTPAASVSGRLADRLTEPPPAADRPLAPAQRAALARDAEHGYEAVFIELETLPDAVALREAVRSVVAAHPQLRGRLDAAGGWLTDDEPGEGAEDRQDPVVEADFTDEAGFAALVAATARTLDEYTGVQLKVLLAADRRPDAPCAGRLAVVAHDLAVDAASWHTLLGDLSAALTGAAASDPAAPTGGLADWIHELRELARDSAESQHWTLVSERRSRAADSLRPAPTSARRDVLGAGDAEPLRTGDDDVRHFEFVLDEDTTERVVYELGRRLALSAEQVVTGVFALALARWRGTDEAGFDVRSDVRAGRQGLRRHVGRLTDTYPVQLVVEGGPDLLGQLTALAGPLAASAGRAGGGAGFGACREWSPDPSLRRALRELPPAQACLTLYGPDELLPGSARPVHGSTPGRLTHAVEARARIEDGSLHFGLDWVADADAGITDSSVRALGELVRDLAEELAATPAAPFPPAFRPTPQQTALYTGGDAQPGTGRHVEQLVWVWHGPLDTRRFTDSWQSVFDCETILRTAFTGDSEPLLTVHERVAPEITRQVLHDGDWSALLERDRLRGFDLRRPGALRLTLLDAEQPEPLGALAPTRIVVTYHRALLDAWSVHILLREFYGAYLAGGTLPGGERRPDLRDYTAWVAAQDLEPARGFWTGSELPDDAASRPGRSAKTTGLTGVGRARLRLDPVDTTRLVRWAGSWGTGESSVLQAVWAMLIYWASGATGPAPVSFAVTVSGRGIPLDGVARMTGPLRNPLPMSVEVDPAATMPRLLRQLRDRALDMAAYEWVPADWIRAWGRGGAHADTVIVFEDPPHPLDGLATELADHGIHAEFPGTLPARSVLPIGLLAHHDSAGGLVLTAVHDRALLGEDAAAEVLAQSALLLRALPLSAGEYTTVGEALKLLEDSVGPRMAEVLGAGRDTLVTLRAARQDQAGTICLIPPPGAPDTCYDLLAHTYSGPQELLVLSARADDAQSALAALGTDRSLLLGGFSGAGAVACDIARRIAVDGGRPPRVVLAGAAADEWERARDLADALQAATGASAH
jgi:hypothetical protein